MSPVTVRDFEKIKGLSDLRAARDGKHAVFCVTHADIGENRYKSHLELLDIETGETRPLTAGDGQGFVFSDDGESVIFPALRSEADKKAVESGEELTVFYRLPLGAARRARPSASKRRLKRLKAWAAGNGWSATCAICRAPICAASSRKSGPRCWHDGKKSPKSSTSSTSCPSGMTGAGMSTKSAPACRCSMS